jgi:hypothetical protein
MRLRFLTVTKEAYRAAGRRTRSAPDRLATLVVDPHNEERVRRPLVVDAKRRERPAVDAFAVAEDVLRSVELLGGEPLDERDDSGRELLGGRSAPLDEVVDRLFEIGQRLRRPETTFNVERAGEGARAPRREGRPCPR